MHGHATERRARSVCAHWPWLTVLIFGFFLLLSRQGILPRGGPTLSGWPSQVAASSGEAFAGASHFGSERYCEFIEGWDIDMGM